MHELALAMPHVTVDHGTGDNPVYQVGGKSFIFFRNPRPDAVDPDTGERYDDVIVFWVASEADKQALVQDEASPFFTTAHFNGHRRCCCGPAGSASSPAGTGRGGPGRVAPRASARRARPGSTRTPSSDRTVVSAADEGQLQRPPSCTDTGGDGMLWYCKFKWHPNTSADGRCGAGSSSRTRPARTIRSGSGAGTTSPVAAAGFMLIETDEPRELTDMLQPYMDLLSWDVHAVSEQEHRAEETIESFRLGALGRQQDDRARPVRALAHAPHHLEAVQARQHQVEHDQVRRAFRHGVERREPVGGDARLVAGALQVGGDDLADRRLVVDHED